jgi:hypothetical protein
MRILPRKGDMVGSILHACKHKFQMNYHLPSLMDSKYEYTELCLAKHMVPQAVEQGEHFWYSPLLNQLRPWCSDDPAT